MEVIVHTKSEETCTTAAVLLVTLADIVRMVRNDLLDDPLNKTGC